MTTPNPKHLDVTPRDFLASLNPPLAVAGVRGRFSKDGVAALATAREDGFLFLGDDGNTNNPVVEKKERKVAAPKAPAAPAAPAAPRQTVVLPEVNPKEVRAWAKQNGHDVAERGRINRSVVTAFLASGGKATVPTAKRITPLDMPKKIRRETTGFVYAPRPEGAGKHISTPLVRLSSCGYCSHTVSTCACPQGPRAPLSLGGAILSLDKPAN